MLAADAEKRCTVELLLSHGARTEARDDSSETALMIAVRMGSRDAVELLLSNGAQIEAVDGDRRTALLHAASYICPLGALKLLLDSGPQLEVRDALGRTALMLTAKRGELIKVRSLLARGAQAGASDLKGHTALWWAYRGRNVLYRHDSDSGVD